MCESHALALGLATEEQIETIKKYTAIVNETLKEFFLDKGLKLIDFKMCIRDRQGYGRVRASRMTLFFPIYIRNGQKQDAGEYKFFLDVIKLLLIMRL